MTFIDKMRSYRELHKHDCKVGGWFLLGHEVTNGTKRWPAHLCTVEVHAGAALEKMKASRVITGTILLGPLGGVIGGMAKVDKSKVFLAISTPDGPQLVELPRKEEAAAHRFSQAVNAAKEPPVDQPE